MRAEYVHEFRSLHPDGTVRWLSAHGRFFYDNDGAPFRMVGAMIDMTERRRLEETQKVMVAELQHRTRNLIGVVRSIAQQTAGSTRDMATFRERFGDRLAALSRVQGLLSRAEEDPITLEVLIRTELDALGVATYSGNVSLSGPRVLLRNRDVQTFALAIHELATNARKYGALAEAEGRLSVTWRKEEGAAGERLRLEWLEEGVNSAREAMSPTTGGYGRKLIERALPHAMGAETTYVLESDKVRCTIDLPQDRFAVVDAP
ncbi:sensor histidine kinase [Aurantimonas sp. 22II-16-19i]|nr:sensor histidine kinase [Aurantimonas sp. 22II-16-19i]